MAWLWLVGALAATPLDKLIVVLRHGARTSASADGALTDAGLRQSFVLGAELRRRYPGFFPASYSPHFQAAEASNNDRTLLTARAFLLGLYPAGDGPQTTATQELYAPPVRGRFEPPGANEGLPQRLQLAPVESAGEGLNVKFCADCPRLKEMAEHVFRAKVFREYNATFAPLYALLEAEGHGAQRASQQPRHDLLSAYVACDEVVTSTPPSPLRRQCERLDAFFAFAYHADKRLARSLRHPLAKDLQDFLAEKRGKQRGLLVVGHDSTVALFVNAFRPDNHRCIAALYAREFNPAKSLSPCAEGEFVAELPFASSLVFEVGTAEPKLVRAVYNGEPLRIFDAKEHIPLKDFLRVLKRSHDPQFRSNCGNPALIPTLPIKPLHKLAFALSFSALLFLALWAFLADVGGKAARPAAAAAAAAEGAEGG